MMLYQPQRTYRGILILYKMKTKNNDDLTSNTGASDATYDVIINIEDTKSNENVIKQRI